MVTRIAIALCFVATLATGAVTAPLPEPRPISDAERGAVAIALHAFDGGASAIWNDLAADSPLRRLGHDAAVREIAARIGPTKDAKWELDTVVPSLRDRLAAFTVTYPSGVSDDLAFSMVNEQGAWKVRSIRTSAEPSSGAPLLPRVQVAPIAAAAIDPRIPIALGLPSMLLAIAGVGVTRVRRWAGKTMIAIAALTVSGAASLIVFTHATRSASPPPAAVARSTNDFVRLGAFVDLRNAIAAGEERGLTETVPNDAAGDVVTLWQAELRLAQQRTKTVRRMLERFRPDANNEALQVLRAHLAFLEANAPAAAVAYQRAISVGPGRDHLRTEAAEMLGILGFDERSSAYFKRVAALGSRDADVLYAAAEQAVFDDDDDRAEKIFLLAWHARPLPRASIVRMQSLWHVMHRQTVAAELRLMNVDEPRFRGTASAPLDVPAGTTASVTGDYLRLHLGGAEMNVDGGAAIAPASSAVMSGEDLRRQVESEALERFEDIRSRATPGAITQPALRDRCLLTAEALARKNRWNDVLSLTAALPPGDERVPIELTAMRGDAMARLGRIEELKQLVVALVNNPAMKRRKDAVAALVASGLLADIEAYDAAIAMLVRAKKQLELPGLDHRIDQLTMEKTVAKNYAVLSTAHLDVRYPNSAAYQPSIEQLSKVLEAEYVRLNKNWFPRASGKRVTVNVLQWEQFRDYSGAEYIGGLYTNQVFLPLAGLSRFPPEIVALATHELTHAFIADCTHNLAPRWFHEALASRTEMTEYSENAFRKYDANRLLSVAVLDAVADGSPDPELINAAYRVGEGTLRYIESRYGKGAIATMVAAYGSGSDTEAAVRAATGGRSIAEIDAAARAWGATQPINFPSDPIVRYDSPDAKRAHITFADDE